MKRPFPLLAALTLPLMFLAAVAFASWARSTDLPARPSRPAPFYATPFERQPDAQALTALGRALFFDRTLSASGRMSCASCHDPAHAYGPPNALVVQLGGPDGTLPGLRAVPSLKYRQAVPPFAEHFYDNDGNDADDQGPTGGLGWDGRSGSSHEFAGNPLLSPFEMANADRGAVVERLKAAPAGQSLRAAFGEHLFDHPDQAWNALVLALEVFQQSPSDFYPYDSKYDHYLRGQARLSDAETRGMLAFNDPARGNCAACHVSSVKRGAFPQFTDDGLIAIGVPRNPRIPANRANGYVDLGLCGPLRTDLKAHPEYCGRFRTPSLRNVATRRVFFHNGAFTTLADAVRFYAQRDSNPARFYPRDAAGRVLKYDDLPAAYQGNVNVEAPFGAKPGDKPSLSEAEVADIVAFLKTLDDGYAMPAAKKVAAR